MSLLRFLTDEVRVLFRGRLPPAAILVGLPLAFTSLFGVVYEENVVNHIPLIVCDQEQSSLSRSLVQMYEDSERYEVVSYTDEEETVQEEILNGNAKAALVIPAAFSRDIKKGNGANILFIVNSANNMFGNAAMSSAQEISRNFSLAVAQKMMESAGLLPAEAMSTVYPIRMGVRILGNPTNGYSPFMLPGLLLNGLQIGIMVAFAPCFYDELIRRRKDEYRGRIGAVVLGRVIPYWLFGFFGYAISLWVAVFVFALPMNGSPLEAAILGAAFLIFVSGAISVFSACAPSRVMALQVPMLYIMPGLLYSGLSWPTFAMNEYAHIFSLLLPLSYAGDSLRDILLAGYAPELWKNSLCMAAYGLGCFLLAVIILSLRLCKIDRREAMADDGISSSASS